MNFNLICTNEEIKIKYVFTDKRITSMARNNYFWWFCKLSKNENYANLVLNMEMVWKSKEMKLKIY